MDFYTAIITCFKKYTTLAGRATRSEYWYFFLFTALGSAAFTFLDIGVLNKKSDYDFLPLSAVFSLIVIIPSYTVACRRLHDLNYSGWWVLAPIGAFSFITAVMFISLEVARRNTDLLAIIVLVSLLSYAAVIVISIWILVQRGTVGPNRFGDDPLDVGAIPSLLPVSPGATPTTVNPVTAIQDDPNACRKCGNQLMKNMRYCPKCGENR